MDFPNKSDEPVMQPATIKKEIKPVVSGVVPGTRPATKRFFNFLLAESPKVLVKKIAVDILVPRAKAGFEEAAQSFLAGMLWGDASNRPLSNLVRGTTVRGGGINYQQITANGIQPSGLAMAREATQSRAQGGYEDFLCPTQQHAEVLLAGMIDALNRYRVVAVGDLYELAQLQPPVGSSAYGWFNLDGAKISKVRDGYSLELPRPTAI